MTTTARIAAARPPYSENVQAWLDRTMPKGRAPFALFATLARDERLFGRFFSGGLLDRGHLTLRQREIVIARTTALCRSEYEWGIHIALFAQRVQFTDEQLRSLAHGDAGESCWSDAERLLVRFCDELHAESSVSDELWLGLRAVHSEEALLELLLLAGFYRTVSYLTNALRLPPEPDGARFPTPRDLLRLEDICNDQNGRG
jgi:alkylhydroperoxidase family enzyme